MTEKARILFVDDEKRVLNAMRGLFRRDYELFLANEGAEAVRIAAENDIDVIVADQRMPGMTGIEVLAEIKRKSPRTVRILLTGYADPSAVEGSINIGEVFRFLSKPCPPKMLRETLSLAINAARTAPVAETPAPTPAPQPSVTSAAPAAAIATPAPAVPAVERAAPTPATLAPGQAAPAPAAPIPAPERPAANDQTSATPPQAATPEPAKPEPAAPEPTKPEPDTVSDNDETQPAMPALDERAMAATGEHSSSHWQSVTNVVMSEDTVEETQENVALTAATQGVNDVGVVVFTVDSEFAATAIRAVSTERDVVLATTLVKVAQAIESNNAGVLVTDFTTNSAILQKIIGALKQHMPELVTIVVSSGRDTTDMIGLINYGQVFRYVIKPIEPDELRNDINAAVVRHLYLLNNPESMKRHEVINAPRTGEGSTTVNSFIGKLRKRAATPDPTDTIT